MYILEREEKGKRLVVNIKFYGGVDLGLISCVFEEEVG